MSHFPLKRRWTRKPNFHVKAIGNFDHVVVFNQKPATYAASGTKLVPTDAVIYTADGAADFSGGGIADSAVEIVGAPILDGEVTIIAELDVPTDFGSFGRYWIGDGNTGGFSNYTIAFINSTTLRFYQGNQDEDITVPTMSRKVRIALTRRGSSGSWTHHVSVNGTPVKNSALETTNPDGVDRPVYIGRSALKTQPETSSTHCR